MTVPKLVSRVDFTVVRVEDLPVTEARTPGWKRIRVSCPCAKTDVTMLSALRRADPDASFEVLPGDEIVSLWFADQRVAVVAAKENRP